MEEDEVQALVIDNGSCVCNAGFAGDDAPRAVFSTVAGIPRHQAMMIGVDQRDAYIGSEAQCKRALLSLNYPISRGVITDWDNMEKIWSHMFYNEIRVAPEDHPIVITEPPLNPKSQREKLTEVFFEKFETPGFYIALPNILAIYASGRGTAVSIDIGDGVTQMAPVYEGFTVPYSISRVNLGGLDSTDLLGRLIQGRGYNLDTTAERESLRELKEKLSYTAKDYYSEMADAECTSSGEKKFELPDGNTVMVKTERFQGSEIFFQPHLIGKDYPTLPDMIYKLLMTCDMDMRKDLYCSLVLSGGPTMTPGFPERLEAEMKKLIPPTMRIKCVAPPERKYSVWIGGSILASLSTFQNLWISREEYDDHGPYIVHKKCFHVT